jgi:hypothetical protein
MTRLWVWARRAWENYRMVHVVGRCQLACCDCPCGYCSSYHQVVRHGPVSP